MRRNRNLARRRGAALILALVVMAVLTVLLSVVTLQVVAQRRVLQQRQRQLQADWLARAGMDLAAARLLESPAAFTDEKHELLADAKVRIEVEKGGVDQFTVKVDVALGAKDEAVMSRSVSGRFRRTDADGVIRVQAEGSAKGE